MKILPKNNENTYECAICKDKGYVFKQINGAEYVADCECGITERRKAQNRLKFANLPENFSDCFFENYKTDYFEDADRKLIENAIKAAKYYVSHFEEMKEKGMGMYLFSTGKGSGKTRLAVSMANELLKAKHTVKFATSLQILSEIKKTWNNNNEYTESQLINQLIKTEVLIIDDFGTETVKDWVGEKYYQIINGRYIENKITIFTSNYDLKNINYDERITDRINEKCYKIPFPNKSVRKIKAVQEQTDFMKNFL